MSGYQLLHRLNTEWRHLADAATSSAALRRWADREPALAGCQDLHQLHAEVHDRSRPEAADRRLAALIRWAAIDGGDDLLAARTVLQLLLPGAVRLSQQVRSMVPEPGEELPVVVSELTVGIRTFPWQRRPRRIAANLLLDARQRISRRHERHRREVTIGLDPYPRPPAVHDGHAVAELQDLIGWAVRTEVLTIFEARLLVAWHVAQLPMSKLVAAFGKSRSALFQSRALAESKLRHALPGRPRRCATGHERQQPTAVSPVGAGRAG